MFANRILNILMSIISVVVIPIQLATTLVLGLLASIPFLGIVLLSVISLIWILFSFPMIGASWLTAKAGWLRNLIGLLGIPWVIVTDVFVALMPSMGELESRAAKLMLTASWPYSWECWMFQIRKVNLYDPRNRSLLEVIERISSHNPLMARTVNRIVDGEALDPKAG